jgi:tetratricopeptide (TPR) repeat protein
MSRWARALLPASLRRALRRRRGAEDANVRRGGEERQDHGVVDAAEWERAERASVERDWAEASERWERIVDDAGAAAPAKAWARLGQARRAQRDWAGAEEAVRRGRERHPDDAGLAIQAARVALRRHGRVAEDEQFEAKVHLVELAEVLQRARDRGSSTGPLLAALGDLHLALRRWPEALEAWDALVTRDPQRREEAELKRAVALRRLGDLPAARTTLEGLDHRRLSSSPARSEVRALSRALGREVSDQVASVARLRMVAGDVEAAEELLVGALLVRGYPEEIVERLRPVLRDLSGLLRAGHALAAGETTPNEDAVDARAPTVGAVVPPVLHVSGFLYSGSSAVTDFLRQHERVADPFGGREVGFLKKQGHVAELLRPDALQTATHPVVVAEVVLGSVLGFGQTGRPLVGFVARSADDTLRLVELLRHLISQLGLLWRRAAHAGRQLEEGEVADAVRDLLDRVMALLTPPSYVALCNNAIIAHDLRRATLFTDVQAVGVLRDPRDQFVSQALESPYPMACRDFITMMVDRYERFEAVLEAPELAGRVHAVAFEDVVSEESARLDLLRCVRLDPAQLVEDPAVFDPERSMTNVGIHRGHPRQGEIDEVQAALGPWYQRLTRQL